MLCLHRLVSNPRQGSVKSVSFPWLNTGKITKSNKKAEPITKVSRCLRIYVYICQGCPFSLYVYFKWLFYLHEDSWLQKRALKLQNRTEIAIFSTKKGLLGKSLLQKEFLAQDRVQKGKRAIRERPGCEHPPSPNKYRAAVSHLIYTKGWQNLESNWLKLECSMLNVLCISTEMKHTTILLSLRSIKIKGCAHLHVFYCKSDQVSHKVLIIGHSAIIRQPLKEFHALKQNMVVFKQAMLGAIPFKK